VLDGRLKDKIKAMFCDEECHHELRCLDLPEEEICEARDIGLRDYLECLDDDSESCCYSLPWGDRYLCRCPVRRYLKRVHGI